MYIDNFYFSFTNPSLFMLLTLGLVLLLLFFVTKKGGGKSVPNAWQSLVELIHDFVPNPVNEQIGGLSGNVKQKFSPCILVTFTFSLFRNPQGMIPFSFTVTSHFLITLALSFSIFIGITIVGFQRHGLHFFSFSLPAGVPLPLAPFLVLLELISHCFRALSSGIRLFANMMAGHSSVKILSGSIFLFTIGEFEVEAMESRPPAGDESAAASSRAESSGPPSPDRAGKPDSALEQSLQKVKKKRTCFDFKTCCSSCCSFCCSFCYDLFFK